ncbi:MAG: glycosyltransferase family 39 protein [Verrucomicrobia bacterium]|nr:glycosyltransferase family 39 protein [Verrucomicrobiota bacterium]
MSKIIVLRGILVISLSYWAACAILLPVTNWDSQVYNLGRLLIAEKAGFWANSCWYSERQVIFPWTFDAVHYPLVKLGFAEALPSFLCLLGTMIIVYKLLCDCYTKHLALWTCLALVSMPTLIYQATSTKNDFAIVFLFGSWLYAMYRYSNERKNWLLGACALSLGFMFGTKTTGIFFSLGLCAVTIIIISRWKANLGAFLAALLISLILFGSIETYLLSYFRYGNALGPSTFVSAHLNRDGLQGALANFLRYYIGNISPGIYTGEIQRTFAVPLADFARLLLHRLGLTNAGYRPDFNDFSLQFRKTGGDDSSDFGIFGWLAFSECLFIVLLTRANSAAWTLAMGGFATLSLICWTVAWMPWNARFLVLTFSLFGVAAIIYTFAERSACQKPAQRLFQVSILFSLALTPIISWDRRPMDLIRALSKREELTFSERPSLLPIYRELQLIAAEKHAPIVYLIAGSDSWVLEFLRIDHIDWRLVNTLPRRHEITANGRRVFVVVLDVSKPQQLTSADIEQVVPDLPVWELVGN